MPGSPPDLQRVLYYYGSQHLDTGSPKALLGLIDVLDRTKFTPCFLASGEGPLVEAMGARDVEVVTGDVASVSPRRLRWSLGRIRKQRRRLRRWRIDLLHLNEFGWNTDLVLAARLEGIAVVLHVHNPVTIHWQNLNRFAAHLVLTVSRAQANTIRGYRRIRRKHRVLHNTIDVSRFAGGRDIRAALGWAARDFVVVTVGQVCHRKGVDLVLDIARRLVPRYRHLRFVIVGPAGVGEQEYADRIWQEAEHPELRGRVSLLGSRQDIPDILASGDVFLFPTRAEPFGIAVVEALAAGLPVIASAVGGIPEIIDRSGIGALVPVGEVDGFVAAIEELVSDREKARAAGRRAADSVPGRFDSETIGREVGELYRTILPS